MTASRVILPGAREASALLEEQAFRDATGLLPRQLADRLITGSLFFVEYEGRRLYPEFLTDAALNPAAIKAVNRVLRTVTAGGRMQFFLSCRGSLGGASVLDALREGRLQAVLRAAEAFAESRCEPTKTHCAFCNNNVLACPEYRWAVAQAADGRRTASA